MNLKPTMASRHKNVVLMIADDLGLHLGCYGSKVQTPNIDRLAAEGTRFTHAFASTASCSGSRSTIYTGLHTHENGQMGLNHGWNHFQTFDHIETLPAVFNATGYLTGIIGKVHVGPRQVYPWEVYEESGTRDGRWYADRAEAFLDQAQEQDLPFHLTVGFRDPHRDNTRGGFGNEDKDVQDLPAPEYKPEDMEIPFFLTDVPEVREELTEYFEAISRMDATLGMLMDSLKRRGLEDSTMVVFVSDNGSPFINSKTTLYDAGVRLPLIIRCPGSPAGVINPNIVSFIDILPTCIDWASTSSLDLPSQPTTDSSSPKRLGRSVLPVLASTNNEPTWQQHIFGSHTFHEVQNYWPTRFLRTRRFKYHRNIAWRLDFPFGTDLAVSRSWEGIRNADPSTPIMIGARSLEKYLFRGPEELFDLENDPEEVNNLANDPAWKDKLLECRAVLEKWQWQTGDVWLMRDGVSTVASSRFREHGLKLADRFEIDVQRPGNIEGPHWDPPVVELSSGGHNIFAG